MKQQDIWSNCLNNLKKKHEAISELIANRTVAYIDIPNHFNVGDLLIYKGTEQFFKNHSINVIYRAGTSAVNLQKVGEADVILLHGGGNFGDLYPQHQNLREEIAKKFKNKCIISLPQTIQFNSEEALAKSASLFIEHPDFHMCVRDHKSLDISKRFTNNIMLLPDMAHSLHPLVDPTEVGPSNLFPPKILNLLRVDIESTNANQGLNKVSFDWQDIMVKQDYWTLKLYYQMIKFSFLREKATNLWSGLSDEIIFKSINYFSAHTVIHTDRLHGCILATLLGKEIYVKDNSYGKNSNYQKAWLSEYPYFID
ncbi:polysaccharide pyruvyl transferase family protein [Pseudoalteromonas sp. NZS11]|uniref:polysaccharide pyruvyl transferase family protein n=1 Tax=Pseudoalteromonas sp. NZS11 TaxID=2792049 RepID=UPI0018CCE779|nr:polysaccharide pyruvyl transferase family protein [Pseudoalteromonas sp. NZS11]MBH0080960.1 polysaccharide pyruvyl transferase family protein [Pseudoalteromonas sp. NZS11]